MRRRKREAEGEGGFTLVEFLVAMVIMMALLGVTVTTVFMSGDLVTTTKSATDLNEEARQAINRMARDSRQAVQIVTAVNPDGPQFDPDRLVAIRFTADYDGDGCIGGVALPTASVSSCLAYNPGNPEDLTYCYQPDAKQLYVIDNQVTGVTPVSSTSSSCDGGQPLLAGNVDAFQVEYRSNSYRFDLAPSDGITSWRELDAAAPPTGNNDGRLDSVELANIDSIVLDVDMRVDSSRQEYRTQVDLRNRSR